MNYKLNCSLQRKYRVRKDGSLAREVWKEYKKFSVHVFTMLYIPEFFETPESINIFEILVFQFTIPHHTVHHYFIFLLSKREPVAQEV
jgi:hypothetical protein